MNNKVNLDIWKRKLIDVVEKCYKSLNDGNIHQVKILYKKLFQLYLDSPNSIKTGTYERINKLYEEIKKTEEKIKKQEKINLKLDTKEKKFNVKKIVGYAVPIILILLLINFLFLSKPEITGLIVLTQEDTRIDNLNLIVNESGNYTWDVDGNIDINSIKASGRIKGNGTVKIYIEKDGEKHLIYDNKNQ